MKVVVVIGAAGGSGATSLVASLSDVAHAQGRPTLAIDLTASNQLRYHFGMDIADARGWSHALSEDQPWQEAAYVSPAGVRFLPFGYPRDLHSAATGLDSHWLQQAVAELDMPPDGLIFVDAGTRYAPLFHSALECADLALVIARPDLASVIALPSLLQYVRNQGVDPATVVNGFDAARVLDRDVLSTLRDETLFGLAPVLVHQDEAVREAMANKKTVIGFSPSCQAAGDSFSLGSWVVAHLAASGGSK